MPLAICTTDRASTTHIHQLSIHQQRSKRFINPVVHGLHFIFIDWILGLLNDWQQLRQAINQNIPISTRIGNIGMVDIGSILIKTFTLVYQLEHLLNRANGRRNFLIIFTQ
ncbi:Uncharacterised protein [Streptococcus pneumoniae]|nr:Uncharacterised protein [Streptococcus pneumoniae]